MTALRDALFANREILGTQFERLGKKERIYLSYDKVAGWSVIQFKGVFGFIQEIFRRYFGFYVSTHWKNVHQAYRAIDATRMNLPHSFCVKIDRCARHALRATHRKNGSSHQFFIEHPEKYLICTQIGPVHISVERGTIARTKGVDAIVATSNVYEEVAQAIGSDRERDFREMLNPDAMDPEEIAVTNAGSLSNTGIRKILVCALPHSDTPFKKSLSLRDLYHRVLDKAFEEEIRSLAFSFAGMAQELGVADAAGVALEVVEQYACAHPERLDKVKMIVSENDYIKVRELCRSMAKLHRGT